MTMRGCDLLFECQNQSQSLPPALDCLTEDDDQQNELEREFNDRNKNRRTPMKHMTTIPMLGKKQCLFAALLLAVAPASFAQGVLAQYNLTGGTPLAPTTVNVTSASSITFGGFAAIWSEPSSGILQDNPGFGVSSATLAVATGDYATFTLTSTTPMDLTSLTFGGAYGQFSNPAGYALQTSVTGSSIFSTAAFATQSPTFSPQTVSLTGASFQGLSSITFDIYGYVNNGGDLQMNAFTVNGSVGAVPEPTTMTLLGVGVIGMFKLVSSRRRN
jgi:hypothetical protein